MKNFRTQLLNVHFFTAPKSRVVSARAGETAEIIVMLGGVYKASPNGKSLTGHVEIHAGDVLCWPAGARRIEENDPRDPTKCIVVYFVWKNQPIELPLFVRDQEGVIRILAARLLSLRDYPLPLPAAASNAYLDAILAEYIRLAGLHEDTLVAQVARYTEEHMPEPFDLKDLAAYVGLERHHFGRKYKTLTGKSPMQHVRRRRAEHALGLLILHPKRSLKDLAFRVGIGDEYQLRRLLRSFFGFSIREWRRMPSTGSSRQRGRKPAAKSSPPPWELSPMIAGLLGEQKLLPSTKRAGRH